MIVDFHTHTYPDKIASKTLELLVSRSKTKPASDGTLAGLQHSMAQSGVDISVVLPVVTAPHQVERINTVAKTVTAQFTGSGVWSFGGIHPGNDNYKEILNGIKSAGLVAGSVINPPNPVKNPVVVHLVTCIRINCSAACSFFPPQFDKYSCASASTDFEPGMPFNAPSYNFPSNFQPFSPS